MVIGYTKKLRPYDFNLTTFFNEVTALVASFKVKLIAKIPRYACKLLEEALSQLSYSLNPTHKNPLDKILKKNLKKEQKSLKKCRKFSFLKNIEETLKSHCSFS